MTTVVIPAELTRRHQWVCWRREERNGKPTKVPYTPETGVRASSTDPTTWNTYEEAIAAVEAWDGIGFVLSANDPFVGVDLDHCVEADTGAITPWAREIVDRLCSYTEITPSRTGLHIFLRGVLREGGRKRGDVEMYDRARFFTVTGTHLPGTPRAIQERSAELAALHARIFRADPAPANGHVASEPVHLEDDALLARAQHARNGDHFRRLWAGEVIGASHSEADLALCGLLAFWTARDPGRIDRLFRASGLMRKKWDERHGAQTYGALTIAKAIAGCREVYQATSSRPTEPTTATEPPPPPTAAEPLHVPVAGMIGIARDFADLFSSYLETPRSFLFFAFLTYFGALIARKVTLESALEPEPRLYTVLLGESADTRKSTALRKTDEFFRKLGSPWDPHVLYGVGSAEGMAAELKECPELLLHYDEFKSFVDKAKAEHSVMLPMVATLFERGDYDNRTKTEKLSVRGASVSVLAACTVDTYSTMFDQRFFAIGLLNRLFIVTDRATARIPVPKLIPAMEVDALRERVRARLQSIDTAYLANGLAPVAYNLTADAEAAFTAWYAAREGSIFERRLDTYGHRLMVLLAASSGSRVIDLPVVEAVIALLRYQLDVRRECDPVDADNAIATIEEKIRRALKRGLLKGRDLKRKVHYDRTGIWAWETAVANLLKAGELLHDRPKDAYWLAPVTTSVTTEKEDSSADGY